MNRALPAAVLALLFFAPPRADADPARGALAGEAAGGAVQTAGAAPAAGGAAEMAGGSAASEAARGAAQAADAADSTASARASSGASARPDRPGATSTFGDFAVMSTTNPPRFVSIDPPAPRLPAPFALPDLAHPRWDLRLDQLIGRLAPSPVFAGRTGPLVGVVRPSMEANLDKRHLYVGVSFPVALGLPPDGGLAPGESGSPAGQRALFGNAEAHVRALFPMPMALEIGVELGVLAPTATFDRASRTDQSLVAAVSSLDPTSYLSFLSGRVGLRPAADARIRRGPFLLQARQGLDIVIDDDGIQRARLSGRLLGHVGYLLRPDLELSIEATQVYLFASEDAVTGTDPASVFANRYRVKDGQRAAFTMGPAIRYGTRAVDVGVAFVKNVSDPFSPAVDDVFGVRFSLVVHVGRER